MSQKDLPNTVPDYPQGKEGKKKARQKKEKVAPGGELNRSVTERQKQIAMIVAAIFVLLILFLLRGGPDKSDPILSGEQGRKVRLLEAAQRNPDDTEAFTRLNSQVEQLSAQNAQMLQQISAQTEKINALQAELNSTAAENTSIDQLWNQMEQLQGSVNKIQEDGVQASVTNTAINPAEGSPRAVGAKALLSPRSGRTDSVETGPVELKRRKQQVLEIAPKTGASKLEAYQETISGNLVSQEQPEVYDTENYVPPNAYAPAQVYVGVDAGTGSAAQANPQVAAFIITGPASHVQSEGVIQTTDLEGCIVNGAATGDLPTERVFIKLQRMTCPLGQGRVSVSKVEGHVTQNGKAGVRGQIVSREGDLLTRAMITSLAEGLGNTATALGRPGIGIGTGGIVNQSPDIEDIGIAALGSGVSSGANTVSDYIIERAKAYDPVVQMPTGVEVELVFISGTVLRPTENP